MINKIPFLYKKPVSFINLPLTLISLEDWALIKLSGPDVMKYLQTQITIDINLLQNNQHILCCHCNAMGKMWSNLRIFKRKEYFYYIIRRDVLNLQLKEIKKYSIFSKVSIEIDNNLILLGIAGLKVRKILLNIFNTLPNADNQLIQKKNTTILQFNKPSERFLIITTNKIATKFINKLYNNIQFNNSAQWLVLEIESGYPIIDNVNSQKFIPQSTNLHMLHGINFNKGCYIGQEIITRTQFRGTNKNSMYLLEGQSKYIPKSGDTIEVKLGENWRNTGRILTALELANKKLLIQIVMKNNLNINTKFRVSGDNTSNLINKPLSYNIK
ncbi:tRNA-modifying protein YgfZ [Serratia symbiotica]|nr:tRNA-modifying protein YgfZ [Serratia symbiotica]